MTDPPIEEIVLNGTFIILDSSIFMDSVCETFFENILYNILIETNKSVIVSSQVIEEVRIYQNNKLKFFSAIASKSLDIISKYEKNNIIEVIEDEGFYFSNAKNVLHSNYLRSIKIKNIFLLTQDQKVVKSIKSLLLRSQKHHDLNLDYYKINALGSLTRWINNIPKRDASLENKSKKTVKKFHLHKDLQNVEQIINNLRYIPKTNDYVVFNGKKGKLLEEINRGNEGIVYRTDIEGLVCKIFNEKNNTKEKNSKLKKMIKHNLNCEGICWPKFIANNSDLEFVGYLMEDAKGLPIQYIILERPIFETVFPHWTRINLVKLSIKILEMIEYLHDYNVIIGDINPVKILIDSDEKVSFIDTDSFQIENYPCSSSSLGFTAPEIRGERDSKFLRNFKHEYFSVTVLLFMILLPGTAPFDYNEGERGALIIEEKIINNRKKYYLLNPEDSRYKNSWQSIWRLLPYKIKKSFYNSFSNGQRISTGIWLRFLNNYLFGISEGYSSDQIFPTTLEKIPLHKKKQLMNDKIKSYLSNICGENIFDKL